jgi:hypothetical protein
MLAQYRTAGTATIAPACNRSASTNKCYTRHLSSSKSGSGSNSSSRRRPSRKPAGASIQANLFGGLFGGLQAPVGSSSSKLLERPAYNKREVVQLGSLEVSQHKTPQLCFTSETAVLLQLRSEALHWASKGHSRYIQPCVT